MKTEIYHIIADQLRGKISAENLAILNAWIADSPENKKTYEELSAIWKLSGNHENIDVNIDLEWRKFSRLKSDYPDARQIHMSPRSIVLKIAAVLVPLIMLSVAGITLFNKSSGKQWITVASADERKHVILPDSTQIWLGTNAEIRYPNNMVKHRLVRSKGEVYFEVAKNGTKFRVDAGTSYIQVMGTKFLVENSSDSITRVVVDEGRVLFYAKNKERNQLNLKAGERAMLYSDEKRIMKEIEPSKNAAARVRNLLSFDNTPLGLVREDLENYFNVALTFSDSIETCLFSGEFNDPQLNNILNVIAVATGGDVTSDGEQFIVSGHSCN